MSDTRPKMNILSRLFVVALIFCGLFLALLEALYRDNSVFDSKIFVVFPQLYQIVDPVFTKYEYLRDLYSMHPKMMIAAAVVLFGTLLLGCRYVIVWFYKVMQKWMGFFPSSSVYQSRFIKFDILDVLITALYHCFSKGEKAPVMDKHLKNLDLNGKTFIGLDTTGKPQYLTESQRCRHVEILGRSGTGKTTSALLPMIFQDICKEKSVIVIDGKGSLKFAEQIHSSFLTKNKYKQELQNKEQNTPTSQSSSVMGSQTPFYFLNPLLPEISNTYNPLYTDEKTDLNLLADGVFNALKIEHEHWGAVGRNILRALVYVMYATGKQLCLRDIYACLESQDALNDVIGQSKDVGAIQRLKWAFESAGTSREDPFAQFKIKLMDLNLDLLNDYNPDIIPEEIVQKHAIVCISLPSSHETLAYGLGNMFLQHLKSAVGCRFYRGMSKEVPVAIFFDEIQTYLNPKLMLSALAQAREANCQLSLAHQSRKDLAVYSREVSETIWDNAQMKIVYQLNDAECAEEISKMSGTKKAVHRTYRTTKGFLGTMRPTFEASNREVDEFEKHPNIFKQLKPVGQGVLVSPDLKKNEEMRWGTKVLNFAPFPDQLTEPIRPVKNMKKKRLEGLNLYEKFVCRKPIVKKA